MKKSLIQFIIPLTLMVCFTLSCSDDDGVTNPTTNSQSDIDAVNQVMIDYEKFAESGDLESWLALWDVNGTRMAPDFPPIVGIDAIRENMAPSFTLSTVVTIDIIETEVAGGWAYTSGNYTLDITFPDASILSLVGKGVTIYKKQSDNSWKIYYDCFNFH